MFTINLPDTDQCLILEPCTGERYEACDIIECSPLCIGHFGAEGHPYPDLGDEPSGPNPNSILYWFAMLPDTKPMSDLLVPRLANGDSPAGLRAYANSSAFRDGDGQPVSCWVVMRDPGDPVSFFAAVFTEPNHASSFAAELMERSGG